MMSMRASAGTCAPAFSARAPFTRTCPASRRAWAFSREVARPRETSRTSRRDFSVFAAFGPLEDFSEAGGECGLDFIEMLRNRPPLRRPPPLGAALNQILREHPQAFGAFAVWF